MQRTIVITGASDGIGAAAARGLAAAGHRVVVVGRSPEKTEKVASEIGADHLVCDFSALSNVRHLARTLLETYPRIDVLAHNAGGYQKRRLVTEDGHELTLQVNHLAPFLLNQLLLARLAESNASVIYTSSVGAWVGRIDFSNLELQNRWTSARAYCNTKLMNIMTAQLLATTYGAFGISAASFHPGVVATNFGSHGTGFVGHLYTSQIRNRFMLSPEQGAATLEWLAQGTPGKDWTSGRYYIKRRPRPIPPQARNQALAQQLWETSENLLAQQPVPS